MNKLISARLLTFLFIILAGLSVFYRSLAQGAIDNAAANQIFYQANAAYKENKYDLAIENYEKLIKSGLESGNLYYNLGNSYFKKGEIGKAILNYERAKRFIPNDSDLKSNYDYARSSLNLGPQAFGNWLEKLANRLFEAATVNSVTILSSIIYIFVIAVFIFNLFVSGLQGLIKPFIFILISLFILAAVSLQSKITYFSTGAIIISKEADIKFEPLENATTYFKLTEGSKVEIIEKAGNWYKIKRPDEKIGWLNKANLELLSDAQ